jgi:hypothetical protein
MRDNPNRRIGYQNRGNPFLWLSHYIPHHALDPYIRQILPRRPIWTVRLRAAVSAKEERDAADELFWAKERGQIK